MTFMYDKWSYIIGPTQVFKNYSLVRYSKRYQRAFHGNTIYMQVFRAEDGVHLFKSNDRLITVVKFGIWSARVLQFVGKNFAINVL